ncbi:Acyl-coenzyme A:6-aminopenicillanic acid acyl-transferase [Neorhodopirellula lusitana]|uniref:Acyl-coenzyme A:6-aminopenicillanic acid acyl-transferase n=2 Tax=Neorhodopirellula lusitana TaxID=445327 RepID=A0ABY1Q1C3_9BACT|nr:Acyl-coenzyme A:6-aminopenicillanic acid acyl-transferase [Neorhodopirellula lusitana]
MELSVALWLVIFFALAIGSSVALVLWRIAQSWRGSPPQHERSESMRLTKFLDRFQPRTSSLTLKIGLIGMLVGSATLPIADACTTAVISGRCTESGRPILWKNRDTSSSSHNEVVHFDDGPISFVAVVNASKRSSVWMGVNEAGFCIENSLSKDLRDDNPASGMGNGSFMKHALSTCRTVEDFSKLLQATDITGRKTLANFGVLDAEGGAAIVESGPKSHQVFDANDPLVAPEGFLVRANFSTTANDLPADPPADLSPGMYSSNRYCRAKGLLHQQLPLGITVPFMTKNLCRDLADSNGIAFPGSINGPTGSLPAELETDQTISRATTVSAVVIEGVAEGEDPRTTTMWTMLGDPKFTIAIPCWASVSDIADAATEPTGAEIGEVALLLREWCIDGRDKLIDTAALPGIWEDILPLEERLYAETNAALEPYRNADLDISALTQVHHQTAGQAMEALQGELDELKSDVLNTLVSTSVPSAYIKTPIQSGVLRVAICDHTDKPTKGAANLLRILTKNEGFVTERIKPKQVVDGALDSFDIVVMPGGSGSAQARRLGEDGCQTIRDFVADGGGYVGICAGAYLASSQYSWSLNLINARVFDRTHWARGQGEVELKMTAAGIRKFDTDELVSVYYGQGPLLVPDDHEDLPAYEVLASFATEVALKGAPEGAMKNTHAIIRSNYGDGRVICFSPHPETKSGPNDIIADGVRWVGGQQLSH